MTETLKLAELCAQKCLEKKAENVLILDLGDKSSVADYFVVCSGFSDRQVAAIADFVADEARRSGAKVYSEEGMREGRWALIDLGPVIVHVFQDQLRDYYSLESLWRDAPRILVRDDGTTETRDNIVRPSDFDPDFNSGSARF